MRASLARAIAVVTLFEQTLQEHGHNHLALCFTLPPVSGLFPNVQVQERAWSSTPRLFEENGGIRTNTTVRASVTAFLDQCEVFVTGDCSFIKI